LKELAHAGIGALENTPLGVALKNSVVANIATDYVDKQIEGLGMGRGHKSQKGSQAMKERMARVRAAKKGGALRPA